MVLALAAFAAAEPEADPYYGYGYGHGYGGYGLGYGYGGYGGYLYGKRSADPEPYFGYALHGGYASVSPSASVGIHGYAPAAVPAVIGGYAGAGRYVAVSGSTVHVAKREAEPYYAMEDSMEGMEDTMVD